MIEHVVDMFDPSDNFHFVVNKEHLTSHPYIPELLGKLAKNTQFTFIEPHELGPTHSALQAKDIPENSELIVSYCDFFVDWNYEIFKRCPRWDSPGDTGFCYG